METKKQAYKHRRAHSATAVVVIHPDLDRSVITNLLSEEVIVHGVELFVLRLQFSCTKVDRNTGDHQYL